MDNIEKFEKVSAYLRTHPEKSDRHIALKNGVSATYVGRIRKRLEAKDILEPVAKRVGADGRKRIKRRSPDEVRRAKRRKLRRKLWREMLKAEKRNEDAEKDRLWAEIKRLDMELMGARKKPG